MVELEGELDDLWVPIRIPPTTTTTRASRAIQIAYAGDRIRSVNQIGHLGSGTDLVAPVRYPTG
jgi:hypothetical protein